MMSLDWQFRNTALDKVGKHKHVPTPGRYVGIPDDEDDGVPFEEKMEGLMGELGQTFEQGEALDGRIREKLGKVGKVGLGV